MTLPPSFTSGHLNAVRRLADRFGFDHCAAAPLVLPERDQRAFTAWVENGSAGEMRYLTDRPNTRLHPAQTFSDRASVLTFAVSYFQGPLPSKPSTAFGRVARYAWGVDYHTVIPARLEKLVAALRDEGGLEFAATIAVDTKPLLEKAFAASSGLGFTGKNTVTILPRSREAGRFHIGSWVFLAEVLIDRPLDSSITAPTETTGCGTCTRCLSVCPTDAFEAPYHLRADRCIAYLTIENKGPIPRAMRPAVGDWVFGCDACQDVCPFNARARETRWPEFQPERGVGPWVALEDLLILRDNAALRHRLGETPLTRPKRRGLVRNACVAAGNSGDQRFVSSLETLLQDEEPLVRGHALWAYGRLATASAVRRAAERARPDPDPFVRDEAEALLAS